MVINQKTKSLDLPLVRTTKEIINSQLHNLCVNKENGIRRIDVYDENANKLWVDVEKLEKELNNQIDLVNQMNTIGSVELGFMNGMKFVLKLLKEGKE